MISLRLADDHAIVRAGLRAVLDGSEDIDVIDEVGRAEEAVARQHTHPVDVVLMDLRFGDGAMNGTEATEQLLQSPTPPKVLIVTNYDTDGEILGAIRAGASGYLLKDTPPEELTAAIRAAYQGESALSPSVATKLLTQVRRNPDSVLTPRELEVLRLVEGGKSNSAIGRELFLSETTIKSHLVHIFSKLGVRSRTAAVAAARQQGLL